MSRRCMICSNLNPCREHSEQAQDAELARNSRAARGLQATTPVAQGDEVRAALEPFARLAGPINREEGRPTYLEAISGPNGTDELQLSTYVGDGTRIEVMDAADFRRAARVLATLTKGARDAG